MRAERVAGAGRVPPVPPAQSSGRVHDDAGAILAVKSHIIKDAFGHIALDGVDQTFFNYLDLLFSELQRRYGERLWGRRWAKWRERFAPREQDKPAWLVQGRGLNKAN